MYINLYHFTDNIVIAFFLQTLTLIVLVNVFNTTIKYKLPSNDKIKRAESAVTLVACSGEHKRP